MDCCENKNITCKDCENICINCGVIHDYQHVNEISFRDFNMIMSNILFYKKSIYKRKKYLYNKCLHIKEINENTILFLITHWKILEKFITREGFLYQNI